MVAGIEAKTYQFANILVKKSERNLFKKIIPNNKAYFLDLKEYAWYFCVPLINERKRLWDKEIISKKVF